MSEDIKDLENPAFLNYLESEFDCPIEPDNEDFTYAMKNAPKNGSDADKYRLAQANKMLRIYRVWKAGASSR